MNKGQDVVSPTVVIVDDSPRVERLFKELEKLIADGKAQVPDDWLENLRREIHFMKVLDGTANDPNIAVGHTGAYGGS